MVKNAIAKLPEEKVLIIDFGSQVTQLIARRIRSMGVYCAIIPYQKAESAFLELKPKAIILSGSPHSTLDNNAPSISNKIFTGAVPVLGICYGQQLICRQLGGCVEGASLREYGKAILEILEDSPLFKGVWCKGEKVPVWMSHGDRVTEIPVGFKVIAQSQSCPFAAIANENRKFYAVQFHPEMVHTIGGEALLQNFVCTIAQIKPNWKVEDYSKKAIQDIQKIVANNKVICALSGGVDSSVAAVLIHKAIGRQLTCIFVDHGLLRHNEAQEVVTLFKEHYHIPLIHVNAQERFLKALKGVEDPEEKRKIIGRLFIEIFEEEAKHCGGAKFLAQGTLYPDIIESVSCEGGGSVTIKSHHNVGGLPEKMNLQLLEPLRDLFKDEVRELGRQLGLPEGFIKRHPFPGPGLAIRCPGEVTVEKLTLLRKIDKIYIEEIQKSGLYDKIWQAFAVLLPIKTVGVMGDNRSYEYACALRAVTSVDGMTAEFYPYDMSFLSQVSGRIINEVPGVNRVLYDITSKPPSTIEWE